MDIADLSVKRLPQIGSNQCELAIADVLRADRCSLEDFCCFSVVFGTIDAREAFGLVTPKSAYFPTLPRLAATGYYGRELGRWTGGCSGGCGRGLRSANRLSIPPEILRSKLQLDEFSYAKVLNVVTNSKAKW